MTASAQRYAIGVPTFVPLVMFGGAASEQVLTWTPKHPCVLEHVQWRCFDTNHKRALAPAELMQLTVGAQYYIDQREQHVGITSPFRLYTLAPSIDVASVLTLRFWLPVECQTRIVLGVTYLHSA